MCLSVCSTDTEMELISKDPLLHYIDTIIHTKGRLLHNTLIEQYNTCPPSPLAALQEPPAPQPRPLVGTWQVAEIARQRRLLGGEIDKSRLVFVDRHVAQTNKEQAAKTLLWSNCLVAYGIKKRFLDRDQLWNAVGSVTKCASKMKLLTALYLDTVVEPFDVDCNTIMEPTALSLLLTAIYDNDAKIAFRAVKDFMAKSPYHRENPASKASFHKDRRAFTKAVHVFVKVLSKHSGVPITNLYKKYRDGKYRPRERVKILFRRAPRRVRIKCQEGVCVNLEMVGGARWERALRKLVNNFKEH